MPLVQKMMYSWHITAILIHLQENLGSSSVVQCFAGLLLLQPKNCADPGAQLFRFGSLVAAVQDVSSFYHPETAGKGQSEARRLKHVKKNL